MKKAELIERVETLRKRANLYLSDVKEMITDINDCTKEDVIEMKDNTRVAETEYRLLVHCAELIDDSDLELKLRDIHLTLEEVDAKRAVHLDYAMGVTL